MTKKICVERAKLKNCPGQTTKYPPATTDPLLEIQKHIAANKIANIEAFSIDGYVVDKNKAITNFIILREYRLECREKAILDPNEIFEEILCNNKLCQSRLSIAKTLGIPLSVFLIPKDYPATEVSDAPAYLLESVQECCKKHSFKKATMQDFEAHIKHYRKFVFSNMVKPLKSAKTRFECELANSGKGVPFPGDVDGLIMVDRHPKAILEFKTHNLATPIEQEYFGKYPKEDSRRIEVLKNLRQALKVPVFVIFWGPKHEKVKIDKIVDEKHSMESILTSRLEFPKQLLSMV